MSLSVAGLCERLADHGFTVRARSQTHMLLGGGRDQIIVPTPEDAVAPAIVDALELRFERYLGKHWLEPTREATSRAAGGRPNRWQGPLRLHAATRRDDHGYAAFVVEEPAIFTHGPDDAAARDRLRDATALWFGTTAGLVDLRWCDAPSDRPDPS